MSDLVGNTEYRISHDAAHFTVSDAATKTNDTIFVSVLMPTPTISTVDSTSTASYTTHSTTDNSTPSMQTSTQSALRPTAITRNETMSAVNLTTTGGNVSTGPQATTVSNYTTPSVTGNSTPLMQSTNQSTTLRPTEHSLLETTLGIELTTQSALRPTVITRNETMSTVNLTTSGNVSTGPWSRVVGCTTRNVGYHTTDYSTKSGGPELHFEMFTVFLAILTTPVVVQNAMKR